MMRRSVLTLGCLGLLCTAVVTGCAKKPADKPQAANPGIEKHVERGPVSLTVRTDRSQITIAEKLKLTIEAVAAEGVEVKMPSFGEKLNEFEIMDFRERAAVPMEAVSSGGPGAKRRWTQEYELESFLSGELEIPALAVTFTDNREGKTAENEVSSEPIQIKVTSLLAGEFDPKKFKDIKGTVDLPPDTSRKWIWWSAGAAGGVILLALAAWLLLRRKRREATPTPLAPHEWAFFALQRLEEDCLIESGLVQEFYFRLSGIVREYIERRFGLMAPERTTPEFLAEVQSAPSLRDEHKRLLGEFLQAADMVKFARYEPAASEVDGSLQTARAFVEQTTPSTNNPADGGAKSMPTDQVSGPGVQEVRA